MIKIFNRRERPPNETADLRLERREDILFILVKKIFNAKKAKDAKRAKKIIN